VFTRILDGLGLALVRSWRSSLTAKSLEAFLTHDNMPMVADSPKSTAGEHSPYAAPAVAGAVLMLVLLLVLECGASPTSNSSAPKASTALASAALISILAELEDLLPERSWMRLLAGGLGDSRTPLRLVALYREFFKTGTSSSARRPLLPGPLGVPDLLTIGPFESLGSGETIERHEFPNETPQPN
jgi:hypothetical protein